MTGIKEILELIAGLKEVGILARLAMKDGKIDVADLQLLSQLLEKQAVLVEAMKGLSELKAEAKDLTLDEGMAIVNAILMAAHEVKEA